MVIDVVLIGTEDVIVFVLWDSHIQSLSVRYCVYVGGVLIDVEDGSRFS